MRSLRRISIAAGLAVSLTSGTPSIPLAQQREDVNELSKRVIELYDTGHAADAIPIAQRVLAIRERTLGRDHPDVASTLHDLVTLYRSQNRLAETEPLLKRAISIREKALGRDHVYTGTSLGTLADLYREQHRYAESEALFQRALTIYETAFGPDHANVAAMLSKFALLYLNQSRPSDAEPLLRRILAIKERELGRDNPEIAGWLSTVANVCKAQGHYADAETMYQRALAILEKALGAEHPDVASSLHELAALYREQSRNADAEPLLRRALAIREKALGAEHPDVATSLNELAELYVSQGRLPDSEPLYRRALAIREKKLGPDHPDVATSLNDLAELFLLEGNFAEAEPRYQRALAIRQKVFGPDHAIVGASLNNLADLYRTEGHFAEAEPLYQRSLAISEKALGPNSARVAALLNNLAALYSSQGRYAEIEPLYQRALAILQQALGRDHPAVATALNNLATLYWDQGRYSDAELLLRETLAIREKAFGPDHPSVAQALNNLAEVYQRQGRHADAEPLLQRAIAAREKTFGRDHPEVASSLNNLALEYGSQGRYGEAEPLLERAIAVNEKALGPGHPTVATSLNYLASLYRDQARYADALSIIRRTMLHGGASKGVALPVLFTAQMQNLIGAGQALADSYEIVQRGSASAAASAVSKVAARFAAGNDELAQLVRKDQDLTTEADVLNQQVVAFVSKPPAERSAATEDAIRKRIDAVNAEREKLGQLFNQRFPDYVALSKPQPMSLQETQRLLADDETLLVLDFGDKSYAWIVTSNEARWTELKVSAGGLQEMVRTLRVWLTDPRQRFDPALAYRIYQTTFGAFANEIAGKKRLSIVTNGALTSLPPQLLVTKDPTGKPLKEVDWLVRTHAVTILPSVASLKVLRGGSQVSAARKPMVAFADPVFSKAARARAQKQLAVRSITSFYRGTQIDVAAIGEYLPQLPGTRKEVQEIAVELKTEASDIKLGLAATETAVKQGKLDQYRIVYFATHGLVSGDLEPFAKSKAEPALALSIPAKPTDLDDGLLTASEIAQLKLDADWVVLSACNTAAEEKPGAEALSGLARAFFYAGARSLIVSHWSVDDAATARLMVGTFRASARDPKLSHAEALREAMLAMIDAAKTDAEADPQLWAPFVVAGEPGKPH